VKEEYHLFLEVTTKFIWEIQQRQLVWRWSAESGVYGVVGWMQGLWASRKSVCLPFLSFSLPIQVISFLGVRKAAKSD